MNAPSTLLPASWVDRIFDRMQGFYGSLWLDRWRTGEADSYGRDKGLMNAKACWCEELGGFAGEPERIQRAIDACKSQPLPPTLPEFIALCRQGVASTAPALPAPKVPPEVARQRAAQLEQGVKGIAKRSDYRKWARDILADPKKYPSLSVKFANEALAQPEV